MMDQQLTSRGHPFAKYTTTTPSIRPSTSESRGSPSAEGSVQTSPIRDRPDPFSTPSPSRPESSLGTSSSVGRSYGTPYFHSRRVKKGEVDQPWKAKKDPKERWVTVIPIVGILIGLGIAAFFVYDGVRSVTHHKYCPVMSDDFSGDTLNTDFWTQEAEVGGFGNGEFEQTTLDDENVFIQDGKLIIKPTLQDAKLIEANAVINLTSAGTCSSDIVKNCVSVTNITAGTIIQPVKSGRINTKKGATIKYGRVEVTAKLPAGDWLWPAIWMLPVDNAYGGWPASGEIDLVEARGNNYTYAQGGNNIVTSTLHWGPDSANDGYWRTNVKRTALHTTFSAGFHTYGLEWSQKYLYTYIDSKLLQVLYNTFNQPLWQRGQFPNSDINGTRITNVWSQTGRDNTPFDQEFYLVLNVAVGGTNGWFADGKSGKPWIDASVRAKNDFWEARDQWYPTWTANNNQGQMEVSKVEMWQQCDGNEDL
ncbi:glycoside hydrolase family 16 protein [Sclerotinia borealis F-4128]|uniref:Glycoside hydrolase family 16 protein n=1 Tax=Sclerotinia borealis (strain F-4128) TaxID=1432307 RepID=W9CN11_SCLBF|nr:glycoside hydrolase family 16 protein [Sclerotinia borealis F-4128]